MLLMRRCLLGIVGLFLAAGAGSGTFYGIGLLLFAASVVYAFVPGEAVSSTASTPSGTDVASPPAPADAQRPTAAWDPAQYLRFSDPTPAPGTRLAGPGAADRTRAGRPISAAAPGNVTAILKQRFPAAEVTGARRRRRDAAEGARRGPGVPASTQG